MKISILCTDPGHPVVMLLRNWQQRMEEKGHYVTLVHDKFDLPGGDLLFLVSCSQLIQSTERQKYQATLVLHASDLPKGRGWSPHIWAIINGASEITVCLLEAADQIDSGAIWMREKFSLEGHELFNEINQVLFASELSLMTKAVESFDQIKPEEQQGDPGPYMPKRSRIHSQLDPNKTIAEQFNLLRVVDSERYPAFMDYRGYRYLIKIEKINNYSLR